jgi:hypothetical protein
MNGSKQKFIRSVLFQSIRVVCPCNHLRTARLDFYGAIGMVCAMSVAAKMIQAFLAH